MLLQPVAKYKYFFLSLAKGFDLVVFIFKFVYCPCRYSLLTFEKSVFSMMTKGDIAAISASEVNSCHLIAELSKTDRHSHTRLKGSPVFSSLFFQALQMNLYLGHLF